MKKLILALALLISVRLFAQTPPIDIPGTDPHSPVFSFAENMPEFPGGDVAMLKFLQEHIVYPKKARRKSIQGRVLLRFVVDEEGSVGDITIVKSVYPELDAEAVRVVSMFPKFKPGYLQGKPVRVWYNLPIVFKLQ